MSSMNNHDKETLSAMLDNEANEFEVRRLLSTIDHNPEISDLWRRMSLVQALLHDDNIKASKSLNVGNANFSNAVSRAIANEPSVSIPSEDKNPFQWQKPLVKLAIAASVAAAFFLGMQSAVNQPLTESPFAIAREQNLDPAMPSDSSVSAISALADGNTLNPAVREVDPDARQRLEDYIRSVSITPDEPQQIEQLQDSPFYRLVNELQDPQ
jgi:sigma-E factor negative regulatory protein RseA